jgi:electron transport complex protein RnfD
MEFAIEQSPHIRRKDTLAGMMTDVLIALSPVVIFALIVYQLYAVRNLIVSEVVWVLGEFLYVIGKSLVLGRKDGLPFGEKLQKAIKSYKLTNFLVPTVSAVIFALITPATYWAPNGYGTLNATSAFADDYAYLVLVVGSLFGLVVGKLLFGGTGKNLLNPAAAAFVFCKFVFGKRYAVAKFSTDAFSWTLNTGSTFLIGSYTASGSYSSYSLWNLIIGNTPGLMGETCKIAILLGLVYLLVRRVADWRVVASFFGTFIVFTLFAGIIIHVSYPDVSVWQFMLYQLVGGGLLFGGVFMITDPVTTPVTRPDRVLYGMLIAICVLFFRLFGRSDYTHEGLAFSILIVNAVVPFMDYIQKWTTNHYDLKHIIVLVAVPVVFLLTMVLTLHFQLAASAVSSSSTSGGSLTTSASQPWEGIAEFWTAFVNL